MKKSVKKVLIGGGVAVGTLVAAGHGLMQLLRNWWRLL